MIIALVGAERVGKDVFADILVNEYGFQKHSMADPIREIAKVIFPAWFGDSMKPEFVVNKDSVEPNTGICPRDFMKWLGTDVFQLEFHKRFPEVNNSNIPARSIWSTACVNRIRTNANLGSNWVIPDVRFKHEAEQLAQLGCIFINLVHGDTNSVGQQSTYDIPYILETYPHTKIINDKSLGMEVFRKQIIYFMATQGLTRPIK